MPHSFGVRARTRDLFSRKFRTKGVIHLSTYMKTYHVGDYVDIGVNSAIQKGMPFKFYVGKTGRVFNVTKSSVGVVVNKRVGGRIIPKKINVRIEHISKSRCNEGLKQHIRANEAKKAEIREKKLPKVYLKRYPGKPRAQTFVQGPGHKIEPETLTPLRFEHVF
eukprot:JP437740.1.p1 GENE.JP437740.1~~JP437740.1.p1  ORF type:complete len:164 (-),score=72.19 JP437740.1:19-510(-)